MGDKYWKNKKKKKKAAPVSTQKPDDVGPQPSPEDVQPDEELKLMCRNPNDQRLVAFEIKEGQSNSTYGIFDKNLGKQLYSIADFDVGNKYFLSSHKYDYTLDEFLGRTIVEIIDGIEANNQLPKFSTLAGGVDTLDSSLTQVVRSLLSEISALHYSGHYHGGLDDRSNIVIKQHIRQNHTTFEVVLVHEGNTPALATVLLGKNKDFVDLVAIIFQVILPPEVATKAPWIGLKNFLTNFYSTLNHTYLPLPSNHSAAWNWEKRLDFFDALHFESYQPHSSSGIICSLGKLTQYKNWKLQIVVGTTFRNMLDDVDYYYYYKNTTRGLVHFLRDVPFHINDLSLTSHQPYYDINVQPNWIHGWYVEYHIRLLWPYLISDIMNRLYQDNVPTEFIDKIHGE